MTQPAPAVPPTETDMIARALYGPRVHTLHHTARATDAQGQALLLTPQAQRLLAGDPTLVTSMLEDLFPAEGQPSLTVHPDFSAEVNCEVHDDAHSFSLHFDGSPYFASLTDSEMLTFLKDLPSYDYETDAIVEHVMETDDAVREEMDGRPERQGNGDPNGFECSYTPETLVAHVIVTRPHLAPLAAAILKRTLQDKHLTLFADQAPTAPEQP